MLHKGSENALPAGFQTKTPASAHDGERYHMLLTDLHGFATGFHKSFAYYTSKDGLSYELVSKDPLFTNQIPICFSDGSEEKFPASSDQMSSSTNKAPSSPCSLPAHPKIKKTPPASSSSLSIASAQNRPRKPHSPRAKDRGYFRQPHRQSFTPSVCWCLRERTSSSRVFVRRLQFHQSLTPRSIGVPCGTLKLLPFLKSSKLLSHIKFVKA